MSKKKRNEYMDIAKGIAIILMVAGHCDGGGVVNNFVNLFHMALFIFISGFFFKFKIVNVKEFIYFLKKRILSLYIFYLKFELSFYLLTNIFFKIGFLSSAVLYGDKIITPISSYQQFLIQILKILILMGREPFCGAFWFIVTLIFINIMYGIIVYISNKQNILNSEKARLLLVMLIFLCGCLMNKMGMNIPRFSPSFTLMLPYYIGNLIGEKKLKIFFTNKYFFIVSIISLFYLYDRGSVAMNHNEFTSVTFLILTMIYGIYTIIFLSKKIVKWFPKISKLLQYIGRHTLSIMGWHYIGFKVTMIIQLLFRAINYADLAKLGGENRNYNSIWYYL